MKRARQSSTSESRQAKITKLHDSFPDWSDLNSDLLEEIFYHLSIVDIDTSKFVCRSWQLVAQSHIKRISPKSPLLLLPDEGPNNSSLIFALDENSCPIVIPGSRCIGSSRGWLFLLQGETNLSLWSPIFDVKIRLPCVSSILTKVDKYRERWISEAKPSYPHWLSKAKASYLDRWISKAVVCCSDPLTNHRYGVVVLDIDGSKLWFAMCGDSLWRTIGDANGYYADVSCHDNLVMAIQYEKYAIHHKEQAMWNYEVDIWDFSSGNPEKKMNVKADFRGSVMEFEDPWREYYSREVYIVKSECETLCVLRLIGCYVDPDGVILLDDYSEDKDCAYWTKNFYVYKLDFDKMTWVPVKDLGNRVLFVGGNESRAFTADDMPMCQKNSIYFTDHFWNEIDHRNMSGGQDMGIFNMEDGSIRFIHQLNRKMSPSFWVRPY